MSGGEEREMERMGTRWRWRRERVGKQKKNEVERKGIRWERTERRTNNRKKVHTIEQPASFRRLHSDSPSMLSIIFH